MKLAYAKLGTNPRPSAIGTDPHEWEGALRQNAVTVAVDRIWPRSDWDHLGVELGVRRVFRI